MTDSGGHTNRVERYRSSRRTAAGAAAMVVVSCALVALLKGDLAALWTHKPMLAIAVGGAALMYYFSRSKRLAASSEWAESNVGGRVRFDRLTKVEIKPRTVGFRDLYLYGEDGQQMRGMIADLQENPALWALVVAGVARARATREVEMNEEAAAYFDHLAGRSDDRHDD